MRTKFGDLACGLTAALLATTGAVAQETTDWSGFYAGVYAWYALDTEASESESTYYPDLDPEADRTVSYDGNSERTRIDGITAGVAAGYNYQIDHLVLGVEGAIHLGAISKGYSGTLFQQIDDEGETATFDVATNYEAQLDWYTSLTGSVGIAFEQDWMVYLKGGVALGNVSASSDARIDIETTDPDLVSEPFAPGLVTGATSGSMLVAGPTIGLGVEKMVGDNLSVGAEYAYVGLADVTFAGASAGAYLPGGDITVPMSFHTVKAALKYHF